MNTVLYIIISVLSLVLFNSGSCFSSDTYQIGIKNTKLNHLVFIILDQNEESHILMSKRLRNNILQSASLYDFRVSVQVASDYEDPSLWIYLPWPEKLKKERNEGSWYIFIEETCDVALEHLNSFLLRYDHTEEHFFGKELHDNAATIIHHFDSVKNPPFLYPDPRTGIVISNVLMQRLHSEWDPLLTKVDFSIDASYEFAKFVLGLGVKLKSIEGICVEKKDDCIIWVDSPPHKNSVLGEKGPSVPLDKIHFAVKTCQKFSLERLPVLKDTWIAEVPNYVLYSDVEDSILGTQTLNIPNVERGHCMKTLAIIHHASKMDIEWLVIADDDTLISVARLSSFLSRFRSSSALAVGERYGYALASGSGFTYPTGGAAIALTKMAVSLLSGKGACICPTNNTPDDMFLGSCLQKHRIPLVHSRRFHQARPDDYSPSLLENSSPISFHKFWMINPREAYQKWLTVPEKKESKVYRVEL